MTKITFIGDCHAAFSKLDKLCKQHQDSYIIQCGDLGLGFGILPKINGLHFIRGNHDKPKGSFKIKGYLGDYGYLDKFGIYYISGAHSVDWQKRTPEYDWWQGEELDHIQLEKAANEIKQIQPNILVTHDCPLSIAQDYFYKDYAIPSRTAEWFDWIAENHKGLWVFGHHHKAFHQTVGNIEYVGLASLETYTIEV